MKKLLLLLSLFLSAEPSLAIPLPYMNCGAATDIVKVDLLDVDRLPTGISNAPFPLYGLANMDPSSGALKKLRVALLPLNWVFELDGSHLGRDEKGFVALPDSWLTEGSPLMRFSTADFVGLPMLDWQTTLPILAGPFNAEDTVPPLDPTGLPVTGIMKGAISEEITSLTGSYTVTWNGISGFPVPPVAGSYSARLRTATVEGQEVLCLATGAVPDSPMVAVAPVPLARFEGAHEDARISWTYGGPHEAVESCAMEPSVLHRPCGSLESTASPDGLLGVSGEPGYDPESRIWSLSLAGTELASGCHEVFVRGGLTGQLDGPFKIQSMR